MSILVCGGMPKAGTTFLHSSLMQYDNVRSLPFKEIGLFINNSFLRKFVFNIIKNSNNTILDFYPEYFFDIFTLEIIKEKKVNAFFIIRSWDDYKLSLNKYLSLNKINNDFLLNKSYNDFMVCHDYVKNNFLTFDFDYVTRNTHDLVRNIQLHFDIDFGILRKKEILFKNSSTKRNFFIQSLIHNNFRSLSINIKIVILLFFYILK